MADGSWYYAKGGQRLGPFTFAQLQQLAGAGAVAPDDPVTRDGDAGVAPAAAVPGLITPAPPAAPPSGGLTAACPKCRGRVAEPVDACPHCAYPQAPHRAREPGRELVPCPGCGVRNDLRRHYYPIGDCRGCGRPLADLHPDRVFDHRVNSAYQDYRGWRAGVQWVVLPTAVALGALALVALAGAAVPGRRPGPLFAFGGAAGVLAADYLLPAAYYLAFVCGRRTLPAPHAGRAITPAEWWAAGRRADEVYRALSPAGPAAGRGWPWWVYAGAGIAMLVAAAYTDADAEANRRAVAGIVAAADAARAGQVSATKAEGLFTHEIRLQNDGPDAFGGCDLTVTVSFSSGRRKTVDRSWAGWAVGERKSVGVPADGRVDRVVVAGTVTDPATGAPGRLEKTFDWPAGRR
ncbi:DUF4339 domain-containing protein [Limnoglobus roseus]|uniref:GYF domain-containing protein n=1 Tax=Limnoglobus roseus TaxID=2598579 RepID=A0A5C1ALJ7_9BACT|nr:DUF4339 domain-containing protein [Limnoglobus roseus]QEL17778.1 hypothetical protein PX52LOC_04784 [Limnoglobus roseus]